jgi:hypothetical protein
MDVFETYGYFMTPLNCLRLLIIDQVFDAGKDACKGLFDVRPIDKVSQIGYNSKLMPLRAR